MVMDILDTLTQVDGLTVARATYERVKRVSKGSAQRRRLRAIATKLADELTITTAEASQYATVALNWCGPVTVDRAITDPDTIRACRAKEQQLRDRAVQLASDNKTEWSKIKIITSCVNQVHSGSSLSREEVRLTLCEWAPTMSCDSLKTNGDDLVRDANLPPSKKNRFLAFSSRPDATGCKQMVLKAEEQVINVIQDGIQNAARANMKAASENSHLTINQAMADVVINELTGAATALTTASTSHQPALIAVLDKHEYESNDRLVDSFGNTFTLKEAADLILADTGWLVIADKNANVVANFNITNRTATSNQRMAAIIEMVTCAVPGCHKLVKDSQIHHIQAYKHGGRTSQENLVGLCPYHNGTNDDDPDKLPLNGRIERDPTTGRPGWKPPGQPGLRFNDLPVHKYDGRALINRALERAADG